MFLLVLLERRSDYRLPAEFHPEKYIHNKGSLAAARIGDVVNPFKESSGSQFYIVHGKIFDEEGLKNEQTGDST